ncbi:hypothetical protein [Solidesulfovibrio carbinolicus]|uniref:hypothetical protein n=1 Tax=Solidesulfovibrio carbinolicus TaxID=296842 RepID=UPI0010115BF9|nr:hypothetical protein [Solidesulfovibrio carbinolicus]
MGFRDKFREKRTIASKWLLCILMSFPIFMIGIKYFGITIDKEWSLAIIASIISATLIEILDNTSNEKKSKLYAEQQDMYNDLISLCKKHHYKEATFIQYSGRKAVELITQLHKNETKIRLFVKHPETAVGVEQTRRIEGVLDNMSTEVGGTHGAPIEVTAYRTEASLRGLMLDDKVVALGWYVFKKKDKLSPKFTHDDVNIWGHNMPGILLYKGNSNFEEAANFFRKMKKHYEKHGERLSSSSD